ncbi:MAG TPA: hypothetical protein VHS36_03795, partial [Candidatus Limnocylindrales bacterium]|nr:hypothetical protein [Candidatus Limnocylindrales bacterium]
MGAGPRLARATPRARPAVLDRVLGRTDAEVAGRFDPAYAAAIGRLPAGRQVFHGLPFDLGPAGAARWMILDEPVTLDLRGQGPATHLVIAHLCDSWRDEDGSRPAAIPIGHVVPVGEPLARYRVTDAAGRTTTRTIRRRFEIDDGILGWGSLPFAAVPHLANAVIDWRGPHPTQPRGSYAPPGQSGALTVLPGAWGPAQTGVSDFVPSSTGEALLWLHAIALTGDEDGTDDRGRAIEPVEVAELRLESLTGGRPGSDVIVAGVTLYDGTANPLIRGERFQLLLDGSEEEPETDLGTVIRTLAAGPASHRRPEAAAPIVGWGEPRAAPQAEGAPGDEPRIVDIALHDDAVLSVGTWSMPATDLRPGTGTILHSPSGRTTIRALPTPRIRVDVRVLDEASSTIIPARVRFVAEDGRYLPPVAHQDEVNPGLYEDLGADVRLGSAIYAYVPGRFAIDLPLGGVEVEAVAGFDRRPRRFRMDVGADTHELDIELERAFDRRPAGWVTTDAHVHFLAPSTALLQAAAEDINLVHLLATQWGDLFTSVTDLPWGSMSDPSGRHQVIVGTENRQNVLGHLGLLGARDPV